MFTQFINELEPFYKRRKEGRQTIVIADAPSLGTRTSEERVVRLALVRGGGHRRLEAVDEALARVGLGLSVDLDRDLHDRESAGVADLGLETLDGDHEVDGGLLAKVRGIDDVDLDVGARGPIGRTVQLSQELGGPLDDHRVGDGLVLVGEARGLGGGNGVHGIPPSL